MGATSSIPTKEQYDQIRDQYLSSPDITNLFKSGTQGNDSQRKGLSEFLYWTIQDDSYDAKQHAEIIEKLIRAGADVNYPFGDQQQTPLYQAYKTINAPIFKLLLEAGADPTLPLFITDNDSGEELEITVWNEIVSDNDLDFAKLILSSKLARETLTTADKNGDFPIMPSFMDGSVELVSAILNAGFNANIANRNGETALIYALQGKNPDKAYGIVEKLLQKGAIPTIPDNNGGTAVTWAKDNHFPEILDLLKTVNPPNNYDFSHFIYRAKLIKEVGHIFGLPNKFQTTRPDLTEDVFVDSEGYFANEAVNLLSLSILDFESFIADSNMDVASDYKQMTEAFGIASRMQNLDISERDSAIVLQAQSQDNRISLNSYGWSGHAVGVGFYKNKFGEEFLVVCNRGEGMHAGGGSLIYRVKPPEAGQASRITPEFIESLSFKYANKHSQESFTKLIEEVVEGNPITFPSKEQGIGNCTLANSKSIIEPFLYLKQQERLREKNSKAKDKLTDAEIDEESRKYAEYNYKKFTKFFRDSSLKSHLQEFARLKQETRAATGTQALELEKDQALYVAIFTEMIAVHHGYPKSHKPHKRKTSREDKMKGDLAREEMILKALSDEQRQKLIQELDNSTLDDREISLLAPAIAHHQDNLIKLLVQGGASLDRALYHLVAQGNMACAQTVLDMGANVNYVNNLHEDNPKSILVAALENGNPDSNLIKMLIENGAYPNHRSVLEFIRDIPDDYLENVENVKIINMLTAPSPRVTFDYKRRAEKEEASKTVEVEITVTPKPTRPFNP